MSILFFFFFFFFFWKIYIYSCHTLPIIWKWNYSFNFLKLKIKDSKEIKTPKAIPDFGTMFPAQETYCLSRKCFRPRKSDLTVHKLLSCWLPTCTDSNSNCHRLQLPFVAWKHLSKIRVVPIDRADVTLKI